MEPDKTMTTRMIDRLSLLESGTHETGRKLAGRHRRPLRGAPPRAKRTAAMTEDWVVDGSIVREVCRIARELERSGLFSGYAD